MSHYEKNFKPKKKKEFGQNFLTDYKVAERMIAAVSAKGMTVFEIGIGDGFLSNAILNLSRCKELISVEIDEELVKLVTSKIKDSRMNVIHQDILCFDFASLTTKSPMVLLANLPYNISVQILQKLVEFKYLFQEGVFMVQEEMAQKLAATSTKNRGSLSLFIQDNFDLKLLEKIPPTVFDPAPKVFSRTVYFKPKDSELKDISDQEDFWIFVRKCFHHPRQTLRNNLKQMGLDQNFVAKIEEEVLECRPQHLSLDNFKKIWQKIKIYRSQ